jgi:ABC-type branched-subunit amino acid transport system substrate-binding protein
MKKSGKKAYIIAADYNYGQITAKWMQKFVKDNGGETLSVDFFPLDVTNFGSTISKIQAAKPDLLLSALVGGNHTAFYRQWTAAGMKSQIPIASTTFGLVNEPATLDAKESDGILGAYGYFEELTTDASKAYVAKMKAKMADVPYISELACCTYEGLHLWANAVKQAGALDRMKVTEALESGMSFDGPSGKVTIDKPTHHTIRSQGPQVERAGDLPGRQAAGHGGRVRPRQEPDRGQAIRDQTLISQGRHGRRPFRGHIVWIKSPF